MTHNCTISIAAKWLDDANNETLTAEQRAAGRKAYDELIATAGFPKKPDGSPMVYRTAVKVGVIFEASKNKAQRQGVPRSSCWRRTTSARTSRARSAAGSR